MSRAPSNIAIASGLIAAVLLWGANNVGVKYTMRYWPPITVGCTRFLIAGLCLLALIRWISWFRDGPHAEPSGEQKRRLWINCGIPLAANVVSFNFAVQNTAASHVALYLGAAPVWALLWEGRPDWSLRSAQRYGSALLAMGGVLVLFWPMLRAQDAQWFGEVMGFVTSLCWTTYVVQCRHLGKALSGAEISAHSIWRAGTWLIPFAIFEASRQTIEWRMDCAALQLFSIVGGGIAAYVLWNNALEHWPAGKVMMYNNLVPLSVVGWAHLFLNEPITPRFWIAMAFIVVGVTLSQTNWQRLFGDRCLPID